MPACQHVSCSASAASNAGICTTESPGQVYSETPQMRLGATVQAQALPPPVIPGIDQRSAQMQRNRGGGAVSASSGVHMGSQGALLALLAGRGGTCGVLFRRMRAARKTARVGAERTDVRF